MHRSRPRVSAWTKDQTCMLIEEIQKHPLLYDQMHPLYQHRAERFEALRSVISNLRPIKPNINEGMITRKLKVLRHQYYNELRRIDDPPEHLLNPQGQYQPSLWCFDLMKFLDKRGNYSDVQVPPPRRLIRKEPEEIQKKEKSTDNEEDFNTDEDSNESNDPFEEVEIERVNPHREIYPKKRSSPERSDLHKKCLKLVDALSKGFENIVSHKSTTGTPTTQKQQSTKTFLGLMVESELATVSEDIYHDAKWKIMRILEEATTKEREKKMRTTNSSSINSTSTQNTVDNNQAIARDGAIFKTPMTRNVQIVAMNPSTFDKYIIQQ